MTRKKPKKPTRRQLTVALAKTDLFYASNAGADTGIGRHAVEVVGPILYDHRRLRGLLVRCLDAIREAADEEMPLALEIEGALLDSTPIVGVIEHDRVAGLGGSNSDDCCGTDRGTLETPGRGQGLHLDQ